MSYLWSKGYNELPEGMYSASIRPYGDTAEEYYLFRAFPDRGDWVVECVEKDLEKLVAKAEEWCKGVTGLEGFYTASY